MLSREQFDAVEKVMRAVGLDADGLQPLGWARAASVFLDAIRRNLVVKVEVSPTATATGTIEGLDGLGRRVGES